MEIHSLKRVFRTVVMTGVVGAVIGAIVATLLPVSYEASLSFTVNQINKQKTEQYQFDGYYALQASDLFSDTIVSWFQTPSFLLEIYNRANVNPNIESLDGFTGRFKMRKYSSQNLVLKFSESDEPKAQKLGQAIIDHVEERSGELNQNAERQALFEVVGSAPVIVKKDPTLFTGLLFGLIAGVIVAAFVLSLTAAFKKVDQES